MKRKIIALALVALMPLSAHADTKDAYSGIEAIPPVLLEKMERSHHREQQYVTQVMSILRNFGRGQAGLDRQDIDNAEAKRKRDSLKQRFRTVMSYDANFDLKVTEAEIRASMENKGLNRLPSVGAEERERQKNRNETRIKNLLREYDADKDGVISAKEVGTLPEGRANSKATDAEALLALDPDKDGILTAAEIEALARKTWRTVDKNDNGAIDEEEKNALADILLRRKVEKSGCVAPPAGANEKLAFVSIGGGGGIPDISVAGQEMPTGTVRLEIAAGTAPVYLVAAAGKPVIWQVTGDTARVSRMIVFGPLERPVRIAYGYEYSHEAEQALPMQAGVVGLDREKVRFMRGEGGSDCGRYLRSARYGSIAEANFYRRALRGQKSDVLTGLEAIAGRKEDFSAHAFEPAGFLIDADKGEAVAHGDVPEGVPEGLDAETWERARKFIQGGLVSFKGQEIVSDAQAEPYKILPGWAGIAQLVKQGALKPEKPESPATRVIVTGGKTDKMVVRNMASAAVVNDSGARIVVIEESRYRLLKDIDNFPPGLDGAYGAHFFVPKGVRMPGGDIWTSCVYSEEKGEMTGRGFCD